MQEISAPAFLSLRSQFMLNTQSRLPEKHNIDCELRCLGGIESLSFQAFNPTMCKIQDKNQSENKKEKVKVKKKGKKSVRGCMGFKPVIRAKVYTCIYGDMLVYRMPVTV